MPRPSTAAPNGDVSASMRDLLRAGLELGVAEAQRRLALLAPPGSEVREKVETDAALIAEFVESVRQDATGMLHLVKEVWSRGGPRDRRTAAHAVGHGVSRLAPHKALGLSRELAVMAKNTKDADVVGEEAIAPILYANPPFFDRVRQFVQDNEVWVRRAAIAGLVAYVSRKKKIAGTALEVILLVAENHEKEIRQGVRWAIREISKVDWKATAKAISDWAKQDPTGGRVKLAKQYAGAAADSARREVEKFVFTSLAKIAGKATPAAAR